MKRRSGATAAVACAVAVLACLASHPSFAAGNTHVRYRVMCAGTFCRPVVLAGRVRDGKYGSRPPHRIRRAEGVNVRAGGVRAREKMRGYCACGRSAGRSESGPGN